MSAIEDYLEREIGGKVATDQFVNDDPWKHRSKGMRCKTCMWFVVKGDRPEFGRCRRHAPTINGYPVVFDTDWCGDHKVDESKVV